MADNSPIRYLKNNEIDKQKWDRCIKAVPNGLIYAYSHYMDHMASNWDGIVLNDYEAVMPLPWRRKLGIYYLYQPFLMAQLGLFGFDITASLLERFLSAIPSKFRYWDYMLNHANLFIMPHFPLYERKNYLLDLNPLYEDLYKNYRENIRRNIKRADQYGCYAMKGIEVSSVINLAKIQGLHTNENDYENFSKLYYYLKEKNQAETYGIFTSQNELVSSCVFLFSHQRAYYILVGNHP